MMHSPKVTSRTLVVSNYCTSLDWLEEYHEYVSPENTIIYSRTPEKYSENYSHLGTYLKSPNVGENIYDILRYIVENYDNLSDMTVFIKGNLFSRNKSATHNHPKPGEPYEIDEFYYTTRENYVKALTTTEYYPITRYHPSSLTPEGTLFTQHILYGNFALHGSAGCKYFGDFYEISDTFFTNPPKRMTISFPPGANYAVPRDTIRKYSKKFYQNLFKSVSWVPAPPAISTSGEAFLCERFLHYVWTEDLQEKTKYSKSII